jgi:hypothetical protein
MWRMCRYGMVRSHEDAEWVMRESMGRLVFYDGTMKLGRRDLVQKFLRVARCQDPASEVPRGQCSTSIFEMHVGWHPNEYIQASVFGRQPK